MLMSKCNTCVYYVEEPRYCNAVSEVVDPEVLAGCCHYRPISGLPKGMSSFVDNTGRED